MRRGWWKRILLFCAITVGIGIVFGCSEDGTPLIGGIGTVRITPPVRELQATGEDGSVRLSWQDPTEIPLERIGVTWEPDGATGTTIVPGTGNATIANLTNGTAYTFLVTAYGTDASPSPPAETLAIPASPTTDGGTPDTPAIPEILISETDGFTEVTEGSTSDTVTFQLATEPTDVVEIELLPDPDIDLRFGAGNTMALLSFDTTNWDQPHPLAVSVPDNIGYQGTRTSAVPVSIITTDPEYSALTSPDLIISVVDDEQYLQIYVTDNNEVEYFEDMEGLNWTSYSGGANGAANFSILGGIAVEAGRIYVADQGSLIVSYFDDMTGTNHTQTTPFSSAPYGMAVFGGSAYISNYTGSTWLLYELDSTLAIVGNLDATLEFAPTTVFGRVYTDTSGIYVVGTATPALHRVDAITITVKENYDGGITTFSEPKDIARDSLGRQYEKPPAVALSWIRGGDLIPHTTHRRRIWRA